MPQPLEIAWIGTGVMGRPMAGHLISAGHALRVHTRTRERADELVARGAQWADSPAAAGDGADIVFSMVGTPAEVEAVHLGSRGTLSSAAPGTILVDMSTSDPALAHRLDEAAHAKRALACDAPVTGGDIGARNAALSIMVGGDEGACARIRPVLEHLGRTIVRHGEAGYGQRAKLVNQVFIAASMVGMCEGMALARAAGLDPARVLESVGSGAAGSWTLANLAPRVLRGDFGPGFMIDHFVKDLGLALRLSDSLGIPLAIASEAHRLYLRLQEAGHGRKGTQALALSYGTRIGAGDGPEEQVLAPR